MFVQTGSIPCSCVCSAACCSTSWRFSRCRLVQSCSSQCTGVIERSFELTSAQRPARQPILPCKPNSRAFVAAAHLQQARGGALRIPQRRLCHLQLCQRATELARLGSTLAAERPACVKRECTMHCEQTSYQQHYTPSPNTASRRQAKRVPPPKFLTAAALPLPAPHARGAGQPPAGSAAPAPANEKTGEEIDTWVSTR